MKSCNLIICVKFKILKINQQNFHIFLFIISIKKIATKFLYQPLKYLKYILFYIPKINYENI